jgi:branched-chain amino acid transport system permease protein
MYAMAIQFVAPDVFGVNLAVFLVVGLVVGGVGTLSGAVVGGLVITFVPLWASQVASVPGVPERFLRGPTGSFFLGLLLIVLTLLLPGGVVGGVRSLRSHLVRIEPAAATRSAGEVTDAPAAAGTVLGCRGREAAHGTPAPRRHDHDHDHDPTVQGEPT